MPRISALILGLSLATGCSKSSPDTAPPDDGSEDAAPVTSAEMAAAAPPRVTGLYLGPALTTVCELEARDEVVTYDPESTDREVEQLLSTVTACVKTGPLQGRRLQLAGLDTSRAEAVRAVLIEGGLTQDDVAADVEVPEDGPAAASTWPSERRVDISVATRRAR